MSRTIPTTVNATTQLGVQYSVIRLYSWPDLPRIQADLVPDVARVCALLSIRPTGATLIPRLLNIPRDRVNHIIEMLHMHGHLDGTQVVSGDDAVMAIASLAEMANTRSRPPTVLPDNFDALDAPQLPANSLIGRLWRKLTGAEA